MTNSLKTILAAEIPLVAVRTRDTINFEKVVQHLTGALPKMFDLGKEPKADADNKLYFFICPKMPKGQVMDMEMFNRMYSYLRDNDLTLIVVNPHYLTEAMFDAGEVPVPRKLVTEYLQTVTDNEKSAIALTSALGGVTLKESDELTRLTMVRDQSLTPKGLVSTRKQFFSSQQGLTLVDTHQDFYQPSKQLITYIQNEKHFFLEETDMRLIPRGLMFEGTPGTGKTEGAKFIAANWGVPLYRVDIGSTRSKWLGESEANWVSNLARLDHEEPCVVLFDEIEKVFANSHGDGSSGTTTTMLSQLLWWLAEHKSRVFTIMTTNDKSKLPPELYRERRIDQSMVFEGLDKAASALFVVEILKTFGHTFSAATKTVEDIVDAAFKIKTTTAYNKVEVAHAKLTEEVFKAVKSGAVKSSSAKVEVLKSNKQ